MAIAPALAVCSFLGGLFDAEEAPCCFVDKAGRLAYANAAFRRRQAQWWPTGTPSWDGTLKALLARRPVNQWVDTRLGDGTWRVHVQPYAPDDGWLGTVLRFTRRAPEAGAPLEQLKAQFLDAVSHELRTPLTAILGYQELLNDGCAGPLKAEQADYVRQIGDSALQLSRLVNDLLDLAALQAGRLPLLSTPLNLTALASAALEAARPAALARGLGLVLSGTPRAQARGDGGRVSQVLAHLLDNALKFTPPRGQVHLALSEEAAGLRVCICDTGPGIPDATLARACESFTQGDAGLRREQGGTGIGLALCKQLIEAQDGIFAIARRAGGGTCASFVLPAWSG